MVRLGAIITESGYVISEEDYEDGEDSEDWEEFLAENEVG